MTKYWYIPAGLILLGLTAFALVKSQISNTTVKRSPSPTTAAVLSQSLSPTVSIASTSVKSDKISLSISKPVNGTVVTNAKLTVSGKTSPKADVFINGQETIADADGNFQTALTLDEGENLIIATVNDEDGNMVEEELVVTYNNQ